MPTDQLCVTGRAVFGFHWVTGALGLPDARVTEALLDAYPLHVRNVVVQHGGLWLQPFFVRGARLAPRCL